MAWHPVIVGSRSRNRARATAQEVGHGICGLANRDAIREANLVIVAVPYQGHGELLAGLAAELAGKIVVDCVNPLGFDEGGAYPLPVPEGSAAQQAAALLPGSRVVAAFHHVSAVLLLDPEAQTLDQDVLVLGDDRAATDLVQALAARIPGVRGVYGAGAQLPPGRVAYREPGVHQPPLQGAGRPAHNRYLNIAGRPHDITQPTARTMPITPALASATCPDRCDGLGRSAANSV